jgi:hypothetical protein
MPARVMSRRDKVALWLAAILHLAALIVMAVTEADWVAKAAFLLSWMFLNFFWLALVRRPIVAALLSFELVVALTLLSRFKFDKLWMTVDFVDVMIIDRDTSAFLLTVLPALRGWLALTAAATAALLIVAWRLDPNRVRVRSSLVGSVLCMAALVVLSLSFPTDLQEDFISQNYLSKFARTGVEAVHEIATHGYLESDARVAGSPSVAPTIACHPARKLPHIILLHDESSFDITVAPGIKVPSGYQHHFQSLDGNDGFYFDQAVRIIERERGDGPLFLYVYNVANHFPWDTRLHPELTPEWRDLGNAPDVEEYIRRQGMTARDYRAMLARLAREFPAKSFLIVRYGDHQPQFGPRIIAPLLDKAALARHLAALDPRYLTTYYAIDVVNFTPADLSSALDTLDAAYLPLVMQEAAGVPLDPGFSEQKEILQRCHGQFYRCADGAEARRFNRLLIDAGLVKGL